MVKNLPAMQETQVQSLNQEDPRRRKWQPSPVFLAREFHGQRSLAGHSPGGGKESDTAWQLNNKNKPSYLPKALSPNTITSGTRASAYRFWEDTNIQSIVILYFVVILKFYFPCARKFIFITCFPRNKSHSLRIKQ